MAAALPFLSAALIAIVAVSAASFAGLQAPAGALGGTSTVATCADSDADQSNPSAVAGRATTTFTAYFQKRAIGVPTTATTTDTCLSPTTLGEAACVRTSLGRQGQLTAIACKYGCEAGACKPAPPEPPAVTYTCVDSDSGAEPAKPGTAVSTGSDGSVTTTADACLSSRKIAEASCAANGQAVVNAMDCSGLCKTDSAGQASCVSQAQCTDSDSGNDITTAGTVTVTDAFGKTATYKDSCNTALNVREYFCDSATLATLNRPCLNGFTCVNGECVSPTALCSDSDSGDDPLTAGTVTTSLGSVSDTCSTATELLEFSCSAKDASGDWKAAASSAKTARVFIDRTPCPNGCSNGACAPAAP